MTIDFDDIKRLHDKVVSLPKEELPLRSEKFAKYIEDLEDEEIYMNFIAYTYAIKERSIEWHQEQSHKNSLKLLKSLQEEYGEGAPKIFSPFGEFRNDN